jgi:hypothetical protein
MKSTVFVRSAFAAAFLLAAAGAAHASPYIVTLEEIGADVVVTGSGSIDLTGLSIAPGNSFATVPGYVNPFTANFAFGSPLSVGERPLRAGERFLFSAKARGFC